MDAINFWQDLHKYLRTNIEVGNPELVTTVPWAQSGGRSYDIRKVKITISNTAPEEPAWPKIVFMGITLSVERPYKTTGTNTLRWGRYARRHHPDQVTAHQVKRPETIYVRFCGEEFPDVTSDERRFGDILFPGQSVTYEMDVPSREGPSFSFRVEATISRRHFLHCQQIVTAQATN